MNHKKLILSIVTISLIGSPVAQAKDAQAVWQCIASDTEKHGYPSVKECVKDLVDPETVRTQFTQAVKDACAGTDPDKGDYSDLGFSSQSKCTDWALRANLIEDNNRDNRRRVHHNHYYNNGYYSPIGVGLGFGGGYGYGGYGYRGYRGGWGPSIGFGIGF